MTSISQTAGAIALILLFTADTAHTDGASEPTAVSSRDGEYLDSLKSLSYADFLSIVAAGKKEGNTAQEQVMPSFGANRNAMCYIDAIYVYLRARSDGALSRQRPEKHELKTDAFTKAEDSCMG